MKAKPAISFLTTESNADLAKTINDILLGMTGNPSYPKAVALLLLVQAALTAFTEVSGSGQDVTALRLEKRLALCALVRSLALDVTDECHGNLVVLLTSKFPIQKPENTPIGKLPPPAGPTLKLGTNSGDLAASVPPVYGALTYNWQLCFASAPTVVVQAMETSPASVLFTGVPPGQVCLVQANAMGTAGTSDWSQTASHMVI